MGLLGRWLFAAAEEVSLVVEEAVAALLDWLDAYRGQPLPARPTIRSHRGAASTGP